MRLGLIYETRPDVLDPSLPPDIYLEMEAMETIQTLALRLESMGNTVRLVNALRDGWQELAVARDGLDLVYNYSVGFGTRSREVLAAAMCEALGVPYTGSDPLTLALAADKHISKLLARVERIPTPPFRVLRNTDTPMRLPASWEYCIIKPLYEGSSIGVTGPIAMDDVDQIDRVVRSTLNGYGYGVLVEEFISGYEVTVPVLGTDAPWALPPVTMMLNGEVDLGMRIFGGALKADSEEVSWATDVPLPKRTIRNLQEWSVRIHRALGCRDVSRSDFRVTKEGKPYYLETNATPQMTPEGGTFCRAAEAVGMSFDEVLGKIVDGAASRYRTATPKTTPR